MKSDAGQVVVVPEGAQSPLIGNDLRLKAIVSNVLATTPGGEKLDQYFGISSGAPEQPAAEAAESDALIAGLQKGGDLSALFGKISKHVSNSDIDPDALRALMRSSKKQGKQ